MLPRSVVRRPALALALGLILGCSGGNTSKLAAPPAFAPKDQTRCGVTKSQARPLIVEWPSADRGDLEAQAKAGLVAVRYVGCEMEVLPRCRAPGSYGYTPFTRKDDRISIRDADELYASVPLGAAKLEAKLASKGELDVMMTIVGKYVADHATVSRDDLTGECDGATHVVASLTAGAFEFFAGADAEVGGGAGVAGIGAGAKSATRRELLNRDGDKASCDKATEEDKKPPSGCGALLRVEVVPIAGSAVTPAGPEPAVTPAPAPGRADVPQEVPKRLTAASKLIVPGVSVGQAIVGRTTLQEILAIYGRDATVTSSKVDYDYDGTGKYNPSRPAQRDRPSKFEFDGGVLSEISIDNYQTNLKTASGLGIHSLKSEWSRELGAAQCDNDKPVEACRYPQAGLKLYVKQETGEVTAIFVTKPR